MGLIWLRIWTSNVLLLKRFHKMWEHLKQFGRKIGCEKEKTDVMSPVIQRDAMKAHTETEIQFHAFLISALDRGECSASRSGPFYRGTYQIRGWVPPGRSEPFGEHNISCACRYSNQDFSAIVPVA
jgi:hypothetical protein